MRKSNFTIIIPDLNEHGQYIVYNTRTQALISINQEIKQALDELPDCKDFENGNKEILDALHENGIVVNDDEEEKRLLEEYFNQIENNTDITNFEVILLTTLNCNFACSYCYEAGAKDKKNLSQQTCDEVISWFKYKIKSGGYKRINITYYGGEPLVNKKPIYYISHQLRPWCEANGVKYTFDMLSNGYLIDPHEVDEWIKLGFKGVQFTVDGDKASHDERRPLINGEETFERIMNNIEAIIDKDIKVSISGNYDQENVAAMVRLLDYLDEKGILRKLEDIAFSPILPRFGPKNNPGAVELTKCLKKYDDDYFEMNLMLRREVMKRGLPVPSGTGYIHCMLVTKDDGVVIDPHGLIYKCPTMVGYPEFSVGDVREREYNKKNDEFLQIRAWKRCEETCPYVPICNGGCRFLAYTRHGNFNNLWCERRNLDRMIPELIRLEYEKMQKQSFKEPALHG